MTPRALNVGAIALYLRWTGIQWTLLTMPRMRTVTRERITVVALTITAAAISLPLAAIMLSDAMDPLPYRPGETIQHFDSRRHERAKERGYY